MGALFQDVKFGLRMLARNPGFTAVAIITLALGIGANTVIFSMINGLFLHPSGIADPAHLFAVRVKYDKLNLKSIVMSAPDFGNIRDSTQIFSSAAAERDASFNYLAMDHPVRLLAAQVSWQWFDAFGVRPVLGRTFHAEEDQPHVNQITVLSYSTWKSVFGGDPSIVGQTIQLNHQAYRVTGVMGPDFDWPRQAQIWVPLGLAPADFALGNTFNEHCFVVARVRPGVTPVKAEEFVQLLTRRLIAAYAEKSFARDSGWGMFAVPFTEYTFGDLRTSMLLLLGAVGFVLLIACSNIAGLILARSSARGKEFAIRIALGAQRRDLLRQALVESFLLAGGGALLGFWGAYDGMGILLKLLPGHLSQGLVIRVDGHVALFTAGLTILAAILLGLLPIGQMNRHQHFAALKEEGRSATSGHSRQRLREVLVVGQITLALVLLVGAGLVVKSLTRLGKVNPGFDPHGLMTGSIWLPESQYKTPEKRAAFYQAVMERLESIPGVSSAAAALPLPFSGIESSSSFVIEGRIPGPGNPGPHSDIDWITPGYFHTMRIPLLKGRYFADQDRMGAQRVVVIDENLARRYWPNQNPIGQRLRRGTQPWATIVGIVGHVDRSALVGDSGKGVCYYAVLQQPPPEVFLIVRTPTDPLSMGKSIHAAVVAVDPTEPVAYLKSMEQYVEGSLSPQRIAATLLGLFSGIALFLAALGLYGVISYGVAQRTREIGIRMALGAQRRDVLRLVVGQGLTLVLIGIGIGIVAALGLTRLMTSLLYGVKPTDPLTFIVVSLVLLVVALLACYIPARRATKVDPMVALRYE